MNFRNLKLSINYISLNALTYEWVKNWKIKTYRNQIGTCFTNKRLNNLAPTNGAVAPSEKEAKQRRKAREKKKKRKLR